LTVKKLAAHNLQSQSEKKTEKAILRVNNILDIVENAYLKCSATPFKYATENTL